MRQGPSIARHAPARRNGSAQAGARPARGPMRRDGTGMAGSSDDRRRCPEPRPAGPRQAARWPAAAGTPGQPATASLPAARRRLAGAPLPRRPDSRTPDGPVAAQSAPTAPGVHRARYGRPRRRVPDGWPTALGNRRPCRIRDHRGFPVRGRRPARIRLDRLRRILGCRHGTEGRSRSNDATFSVRQQAGKKQATCVTAHAVVEINASG